ncbi:MAG: hypothetical protein IKO61_04835 [Lachnospiraceae bacterium]|nr:hypothetical protein [Lachnospiraceae bacterium]
MFGVYFGKYLVDMGIISEEVYAGLLESTKNDKVKMGLLAVDLGLMTEEQAQEVNQLQQMLDKRFGDIAIEKGYLTEDDVYDLLDKQGDAYLLFVQAVLESGIMDFEDIKTELGNYRRSEHLTLTDVEAIKTGDVDRIVPIFMKDMEMPEHIRQYISLSARNIVRFIDRFFIMERIEKIDDFELPCAVMQIIHEDGDMLIALGGLKEDLEVVSGNFVKNVVGRDDIDFDSLDVAGEFLNVNNGLYVSSVLCERTDVRVESPVIKTDGLRLRTDGKMYIVPLLIDERPIEFIICTGNVNIS